MSKKKSIDERIRELQARKDKVTKRETLKKTIEQARRELKSMR
jgi:hypothetical protein